MKIALILDNNQIEKWQLESLYKCGDEIKIDLILNCQNTKNKRSIFVNFLYYFFNFFLVRNRFRQKFNINKIDFFKNIKNISFHSKYDGNWQIIQNKVIEDINKRNIKNIVKFGMGLLKINDNISNFNILSFHHGDPKHIRGKAPCFYEILYNHDYQGIIVQKISNNIDGGKIYYKAKSKIYYNSYKKSLENTYKVSTYILKKAVHNLKNDICYDSEKGPFYNLPSNVVFFKFIIRLLSNYTKRILYLFFYYKKWEIGLSYIDKDIYNFNINKLDIKFKNILFFADPFFVDNNNILIEGFNFIQGVGQIFNFNINNKKLTKVSKIHKHIAYPSIFNFNDKKYVLPEISNYSSPQIYELCSSKELSKKKQIRGLSKYKLIDPTHFYYNNYHYIFCNIKNKPIENLYLFYSKNLNGEYKPHHQNPICIDITKARMGGNFFNYEKKQFRPSQYNIKEYGNGILINEIKKLTPFEYEEKKTKLIKFDYCAGPHTINFSDKQIVYDFYLDKFNFFSILYRINSYIRTKYN